MENDFGSILWQLQSIDQKYMKRRKERSILPGSQDRSNLAQEIERIKLRIREIKGKHASILSHFNEIELDLHNIEEHIAFENKRLYSGQVTNTKELTQLEHKLEEDQKKRTIIENNYILLIEELDSVKHGLDNLLDDETYLTNRFEQLDQQLKKQRQEDTAYEEEYCILRQRISTQLPMAIREKYEHIQARYQGNALVRIVSGGCGGCHTALAAAEIERVKRGISTCDNCGRLLASEY